MAASFRFVACGALALLAGLGVAHAADDKDFAKALFADPAPTAKTRACFVRHYDAAHMAAHPKQRVSDMMLLVGREKNEDDQSLRYQFQLSTHFSSRKGRFESGGDCRTLSGEGAQTSVQKLTCVVECDGGDIAITPAPDSKSAMARVERLRIWRAGAQFDEAANDEIAGGDDKLFRLDRAPLDQCTPLLPKAERVKRLSRKK